MVLSVRLAKGAVMKYGGQNQSDTHWRRLGFLSGVVHRSLGGLKSDNLARNRFGSNDRAYWDGFDDGWAREHRARVVLASNGTSPHVAQRRRAEYHYSMFPFKTTRKSVQ
jgi:hypothetical protein